MNRKLWAGLGAAVMIIGLAGCADTGTGESAPSEEQQQSAPAPDLTGIPDIVAEVNGVQITKDEFIEVYEGQFQQMQAQAESNGQQVDEGTLRVQTAEALVDTELLLQQADEQKLEVSQKDLDAALEEIAAGSGMESVDDVLAALAEQGLDEGEVFSQLETQVRVEKLVSDSAGDTTPTEAELRELYDQAAAQQGQSGGEGSEMPPFEDVRPQLEEQVVGMKEQDAYAGLVEELRKGADITVNL